MNLIPHSITFALPLLFLSGCNIPADSPLAVSPTAQSKNFTVEEIQFTFPYPATWGEVISERRGADVECPPLAEGEPSMCSNTSGSSQKLTFKKKENIELIFIESGDDGNESSEKLPHFCDKQSKDEPLLIDGAIGYCGKTEEGKITYSTLSQRGYKYLPEQQIFYPLQPGKFDELTVYKALPIPEECKKSTCIISLPNYDKDLPLPEVCRKGFANILGSEEEKHCIQKSLERFTAESTSTEEGREFTQFLKHLSEVK